MSNQSLTFAGKLEVSWQRTANYVEANSNLFAIALCLCFATMTLIIAARRPLWYDEILTVSIAQAPAMKDVLASFRLNDMTPPLNAFVVKLFGSLLGWTELIVRLPSVIFATCGLFIVFRAVRRLTNGLFGLAAMSIVFDTFLSFYAYEARPYALLFFASTLALWFWTSEPEVPSGESGRTASILFGMALMLAVLAHYYGVLLIVPFAAEGARARGLRSFLSFRLLCGVLGMALALAVQLPFLQAGLQRRLAPFRGVPSFGNLQRTYPDMLTQLPFLLVCVIVFLAWVSPGAGGFVASQTSQERLGWFFLLIPVAGYVTAELVTHAFWARYFISLLAGFALAFGCLLYRHYQRLPHAPLSILLIAVLLFLQSSLSHFRYARTSGVSNRAEESDLVDRMLPELRQEGKRIVLLSDFRIYLEARYYATDPKMIWVLYPPNYKVPLTTLAQNPLRPQFFSAEDIRKQAHEMALVTPSAELLSSFENLNFHLHWRMTKPEVIYLQ